MRRISRPRWCAWLAWLPAIALALWPMPASAQPGPPGSSDLNQPAADRPWAAGVSEQDQTAALELYNAGNRDFVESRFADALDKYKLAIKSWDHPAIRFNMAVCLIKLDQPLEAMDNLTRSLAFGEAPLGNEYFQQAQIYRQLLDAQLARVTITAHEPGTRITVDGVLLFTAPGTAEQILLPGGHQVTATRAGFLTLSKALVTVAGKRLTYDVPALERRVATQLVRYWPTWLPWFTVAAGAALIGGGTASYLAARNNFARYDRGITIECPAGCGPGEVTRYTGLTRDQSHANTEQVVAFSLLSVGATAVLAGGVGLIVNQPHLQIESEPRVVVTPRPGGALVGLGWNY